MEAAGWGGVLLTTYTKFTFSEFRVCVRAVFAFGAGYKLGERYELGELERRRAQAADPEAWQLGYDLSTRRYEKAYGSAKPPEHKALDELYYRHAAAGCPAEVVKDDTIPESWRVEKLDSDGDGGIDITIFDGPNAERRAREYAPWKYGAS